MGSAEEVPQRVKMVDSHPVPLYPEECEPHTPTPAGLQWWAWSEEMAKTHDQRQCKGCGLWAIWEPRSSPAEPAGDPVAEKIRADALAWQADDHAPELDQ